MQKIISSWNSKRSETRVMIVGNIILLIGFFALSFGFFVDMIHLPLGVALACPFVNLNYFLYTKSVDNILENKSGKGKVRIDFIWRYLVLLIPVIVSLILWYFSFEIFNPIVVGVSIVAYRIGLYLPITRDNEDE